MMKAAQVINPQMILILLMMMLGATPSRGKNAKSLLNLQQRILPTAMNRGIKNPKVAPQYKSSSESDSDNDDVGAQPPRGKNEKSLLNQ